MSEEPGLGFRVTKMLAYLAQGPGPDGPDDEGLVSWSAPNGLVLPLVAADVARETQLDKIAQVISTQSGRRVTKAIFTVREDLEVFEPGTGR